MNRKSIISLTVMAAVALLLFIGWTREISKPETVKRTQVALGTFVEIEIRNRSADDANGAISAAFQEMKRIHEEFSPFNESGPLWRVNHATAGAVSVSPELYGLLRACDRIHKETDGAFDPAMEALFRVWRIWDKETPVPSPESVETARAISGWSRIRLGDNLELARPPGVEISLGAIAKGYAVDRMTEVLKSHGIDNALVNAGGEIRTLGEGWIVGIQQPSIRDEMVRTINLSGLSVATSGDYEQHREEKGKRYHHILDPATGYPAAGCSSVTVVAETCMEADAYATGVFVLGPERGLDLVNRTSGMEAMIIDPAGKVYYSDGFENYIWRKP